MEKVLIFVKHHFKFIWSIIEYLNGVVFSLFFSRKLTKLLPHVFGEFSMSPYTFRSLIREEDKKVYDLIHSQDEMDLKYFQPHGFDLISIRKQFSNRAFLMMGAFLGDRLIAYFFLRFFVNRKCFVGRIIDSDYRGKGIGNMMNNIMYRTAWSMNFKCLSTISNKNKAVINAHSKNPNLKVVKELSNGYLLVEFVEVD